MNEIDDLRALMREYDGEDAEDGLPAVAAAISAILNDGTPDAGAIDEAIDAVDDTGDIDVVVCTLFVALSQDFPLRDIARRAEDPRRALAVFRDPDEVEGEDIGWVLDLLEDISENGIG